MMIYKDEYLHEQDSRGILLKRLANPDKISSQKEGFQEKL